MLGFVSHQVNVQGIVLQKGVSEYLYQFHKFMIQQPFRYVNTRNTFLCIS